MAANDEELQAARRAWDETGGKVFPFEQLTETTREALVRAVRAGRELGVPA